MVSTASKCFAEERNGSDPPFTSVVRDSWVFDCLARGTFLGPPHWGGHMIERDHDTTLEPFPRLPSIQLSLGSSGSPLTVGHQLQAPAPQSPSPVRQGGYLPPPSFPTTNSIRSAKTVIPEQKTSASLITPGTEASQPATKVVPSVTNPDVALGESPHHVGTTTSESALGLPPKHPRYTENAGQLVQSGASEYTVDDRAFLVGE